MGGVSYGRGFCYGEEPFVMWEALAIIQCFASWLSMCKVEF